jgi:hypothetical protein
MSVLNTTAAAITLVVLVSSSPSYAQSSPQGFFGAGAAANDGGPNLYLAGGVEKNVSGVLSVGLDAGLMLDPDYYVVSALIGAAGGRQLGFQPFFSTGVSVIGDPGSRDRTRCCGPGGGWNLGGGTNYWFRNRFGIRFDARGVLGFGEDGGGMAMTTVGIVFR